MQIQMMGGVVNAAGTSYQNAFNERIYRVARNSNTKTATITAASFIRGGPAILATATASLNGYDIVQPTTAGQDVNNLLIGVVYDYPDTSVARNGVWQPEDVGLVQCYGFNSAIYVQVATKTSTLGAGQLLTPSTGSSFQTAGAVVAGTATVASSAIFTQLTGVGGLVILMDTASMASETGLRNGFIRCM